MGETDNFQGTPWNAVPTEEWNQPAYWNSYYQQLLNETDPWRRKNVVHRGTDLLTDMLTTAGELPSVQSVPLLDAGCGIALIPHLLAQWGFKVTAIDSCPLAIQVAAEYGPTDEEVARCIEIWDPDEGRPRTYTRVDDPARSLKRLQGFQAPGGLVNYIAADWFDPQLQVTSFGIVYCRNSLRCATKPYWRRSLLRFHELLSPGGILLLENVNAIGIQDEVIDLLLECGFVTFHPKTTRTEPEKYVLDMWPTG